jgi:hypothetical protein
VAPTRPCDRIVAAALLGAVACGGEAYVHLAQEVFDVQIQATEECPSSVTAHVTLGIGACDQVLSPSVERRRGDITVRPWVATRDEDCILILLGHDLEVPLGPLEPFRLVRQTPETY